MEFILGLWVLAAEAVLKLGVLTKRIGNLLENPGWEEGAVRKPNYPTYQKLQPKPQQWSLCIFLKLSNVHAFTLLLNQFVCGGAFLHVPAGLHHLKGEMGFFTMTPDT